MKTNLLAGAVVAAVLVSACAFSPQVAQINPGLDVASGDLGKSTTVAFRVVDERDSKSIGNRCVRQGCENHDLAGCGGPGPPANLRGLGEEGLRNY